eukprot:85634-Prymnesium_polylepis.1
MIISFAKVLLSPYPALTGPLPKEAEPDKHQTKHAAVEAAAPAPPEQPPPLSRTRSRREASNVRVIREHPADGEPRRVDDGANGAAANEGVGRT